MSWIDEIEAKAKEAKGDYLPVECVIGFDDLERLIRAHYVMESALEVMIDYAGLRDSPLAITVCDLARDALKEVEGMGLFSYELD